MSKPRETTIQDKALEYLKSHYSKENGKLNEEIYGQKEKWTKKEFGGKRADGLICFKKDDKFFTASLEAKSHRTLGALISSYNDEKFLFHSLIPSSIVTPLIVMGCIFYTDLQWYFITLIGVGAFIAITIGVAAILDFLDLNNHRVIGVVNQLKQYPANEQWIAYSKHTDNLLLKSPFNRKKDNLQILDEFCKKYKFGLLIVSGNKVDIKRSPISKKGEFLHCYSQEKEIKKNLEPAKSITHL